MLPRTWLLATLLFGCGPTRESTSDATSSSTTATGPSCESYLDVLETGPSVAITVRNLSSAAVFLPATSGCFFTPAFTVATADGEAVVQPEDPSRLCASIIANADCDPYGADCGMASAGRLEPGAQDEGSWSGAQAVAIELVSACAPEPSCPASCLQLGPVAAGSYDVRVTAYRQCTGACTCDGEGPEVCGLYGEHTLAEPQTFTTRIDYPTQTSVEIAIVDG
ncbi:MAG: hypothetical protein JNK45_36315 [Myxococcales bacterium]|nr:hypothetical protein [Myxococcales bacterium]